MADVLKSNLFFTSSLDLKGQLTQNFVGSITVTGRSKMAKLVPTGNPDGCQGAILKIFFFSFFFASPEPKG